MKKYTKCDIISDLIDLGIKKKDTLFVTADLMKTNYLGSTKTQTLRDWVDIFKEVLSEEGTFMTVSYTKSYPLFAFDKKYPFSQKTKTSSGSFSKALLEDSSSFRSKHPTNSYVAIGHNAKYLLEDHDENGLCYDPPGKIIDLNGKNLMLGTIDNKNAPMVFHYVQQILGITKKNLLSGLTGCHYIKDDNELRKFIRKDVGGCSKAGNKLYSYFLDNECIKVGKVGNAVSALIDAKKSFEITYEILKNNPNFSICDSKDCNSCSKIKYGWSFFKSYF